MRIKLALTAILTFPVLFAHGQDSLKWYKGNTHTHSYWSDGNDFPEMIISWYKEHGYDFISLSDHNILATVEKWKTIPSHPFRQKGFRQYIDKFGKDWVEYRTDSSGEISVRLKRIDEYRTLFEEPGKFLIMQAEEITDSYNKKPIHIGAINIREKIDPQGGNSVAEVMQHNLDEVYRQRKLTGQKMFAHINHPNFGWAISYEDMKQLNGERFFEVFNGHPHVHNYGDSSTIGMDELWDKLLISYIKDSKPLLYGLATDDSHDYLQFQVGNSNPGRGWIMVKADTLTPKSLVEAMERGDFYATTGVTMTTIGFENNILTVAVQPEKDIQYTIEFWGAKDNHNDRPVVRKLLKKAKGTQASYRLHGNDLYVRAKIISSKPKENPFQEGDMETAWIQPVMPEK